MQKPEMGDWVGSADILKSVYSALFLDKRKSGKFSISVRIAANSRCLVDVYYFYLLARERYHMVVLHICVRLLRRLLVLQRWAIPEPPFVRTSNSTGSHAFSFY